MKFFYGKLSIFCILACLALAGCNCDDDDARFSEVKGKPIEFDFNVVTEEHGLTRSTALSTSNVIVWVTVNAGTNWYPYKYDSAKNLWVPVSSPITWTEKTMTVYAAVRYDIDYSNPVWSNTFTVKPDQSSEANKNISDFLGTRQHITYTSGRINLTLQHRVAKLVVQAQLDASDQVSNLKTCVTHQGGVYNNVTDPGTYFTTGTVTCGDMNVDLLGTGAANYFTLYKDNSGVLIDNVSGLVASRTATFYAYMLPLEEKIRPFFRFSYNNAYNYTPSLTYNQGGMALDGGCISCVTIIMPNVP